MDTPESLSQTLSLERIEENLFRGDSPKSSGPRIFGGQVIAQSLLAAYETIESRVCHSLHCYFIRPGDSTIPILFEVDRARDGGSFTTRRVVAIQRGKQIFNLAASFKDVEQGYEHQMPPPSVPAPDKLPDEQQAMLKAMEKAPEEMRRMMGRPRPIEMRPTDGSPFNAEGPRDPRSDAWMRATTPIGDDPKMHQVVMAYASDMNMLSTSMRPHRVHWNTPGLQSASLDHAIWFHRPSNFNDWHLYTQDSPSASDGRGFVRGAIYTADGTLVASVAQEGLIRQRKPA